MYFAFVESIDELNGDALKERDDMPDYWRNILDRRDDDSLQFPTHGIWLDCVRYDYFSSITWRGDVCRRNEDEDAVLRRKQLIELDANQFAVILLLMNHADGSRALESFQEGSWHEIQLRQLHGLPVVAASDFDVAAVQACRLEWRYEVERQQRDVLHNVFNLEFLPDARWGGRGGEPWRPLSLPPSKDMGLYDLPYHMLKG
ncbi:hypothetical protein [Dyella nitratireducens]|uniref:hypothetical protein n=1 Tax=Dyella nitratireducens TaxID=1849580 RepID=UPI001662E38D|nr:hypothetical protein [Dyella nitratireducens]